MAGQLFGVVGSSWAGVVSAAWALQYEGDDRRRRRRVPLGLVRVVGPDEGQVLGVARLARPRAWKEQRGFLGSDNPNSVNDPMG